MAATRSTALRHRRGVLDVARAILRGGLRPQVRLAGRSWPVYGLCVCGGALLAAGWMTALAAASGTSPRWALLQALIGIVAALALAYATKAFTGGERFTFYHYQLFVLVAGSAAAAWMDRAALAGLDVLAVGLAVAHGVGRLGCLAAGCCHGRAVPWGIRYGSEHAADGFPSRLVGVPLLPVQLFESLALGALAVAGSVLVVAGGAGNRPGSALALYVGGYGVVRFLLERWRGDRRPSFGPFSEAQWTALFALATIVVLAAAGVLPLGPVMSAIGVSLLVALIITGLLDHRRHAGGLLAGAHCTEVAAHLAALLRREERSLTAEAADIPVRTTTRQLRLSTGLLLDGDEPRRLVSFSTADAPLPASAARSLAALLVRQLGAGARGELRCGAQGVWHLLVPASLTAGRA